MPGVPTGRGCEGCRRRKKKCDQATPSCSRCIKLGITCVGSGQRRYKFMFMEEDGFQSTPTPPNERSRKSSPRHADNKSLVPMIPPQPPANKLARLTNAYVEAIKTTTDMRFNLAWWYGDYLIDIPQHLGVNLALDTATEAVIHGHYRIMSGQQVNNETLMKYSVALRALRASLDDPVTARTSETLCAVMMLMNCQSYIGNTDIFMTGHCEGAAQIIKARGYYDPEDSFEVKMIRCLRGPVVFEAVFNRNIQLTAVEYTTLVANHLDGGSVEGKIMVALSHVPLTMNRKQEIFNGEPDALELLEKLRVQYYHIRDEAIPNCQKRYERTLEMKANETSFLSIPIQAHCYMLRILGLTLYISCVLNRVLNAFDIVNPDLDADLTWFADESWWIIEESIRYRPMASAAMPLYFTTVWLAARDDSERRAIELKMGDYLNEFNFVFTPDTLQRVMEQAESVLNLQA